MGEGRRLVEDVAAEFGVQPRVLRTAHRRGLLPGLVVGRKLWITDADIEVWKANQAALAGHRPQPVASSLSSAGPVGPRVPADPAAVHAVAQGIRFDKPPSRRRRPA